MVTGLAVLSLRETHVTLLPHRRAGDLLNRAEKRRPGSPRPGADSLGETQKLFLFLFYN
jgi:hypothetical protein